MKRIATLVMTAVLTFGLVGGAAAQTEGEDLTSTSIFPPDSPLFAIQHVLDALEEFLAFDEATKAAVLAKIADNRLAEASEMLKARKTDVAANMTEQMKESLQKAAQKAAEAQAKAAEAKAKAAERSGEDREREEAKVRGQEDAVKLVLSRLEENLKKQQASLQKALDEVENPRAKEAIQKAMNEARKGLENAMERVREGGTDAPEKGAPGKPEQTGRPAGVPTGRPESAPTGAPAGVPTGRPESVATGRPAGAPTGRPEATRSPAVSPPPAVPAKPATPTGRP